MNIIFWQYKEILFVREFNINDNSPHPRTEDGGCCREFLRHPGYPLPRTHGLCVAGLPRVCSCRKLIFRYF